MNPKILVGCPTYDGKNYCFDAYIKALKELTYPEFDILLVDNSPSEQYFKKIQEAGINVIKDLPRARPHDSIVQSRNIIRERFLKGNYDYLLSLEQDVIPPENVIEKLLRHNKKVISGVYYTIYTFHGIPKLRPLIWADVPGEPDKMRFMNSECTAAKNSNQPVLKKIKMCGLGCVLIHKSVLEKIKFRVPNDCSTYDDFAFCSDARESGENIWADLSLQCKHIIKKE
ncbi:hypothetical protein JW851_01755 [Candidatus Woesearchaeota archaeon]|nr:hypothetical protein [Candidatus Woesearchaeota archaeon]